MSEPTPWHQLFGLTLTGLFEGTGVRVELEKDLSLKRQLLDVALVRPKDVEVARPLPDGLGPLAPHTLITFKSHRDALDGWAMEELVAHYVNYRKQAEPDAKGLPPVADIRTVAVTARYPRGLAAEAELRAETRGVYETRSYGRAVRVVVANELSREPHNAPLLLFAADEELFTYGAAECLGLAGEVSTLLRRLIARYRGEGFAMAESLQEFARRARREDAEELLAELTPEERLAGLTPEQRLAGLPPEQRLAGLPPEERLAGLPPEERLAGLTPDQLAELVRLAQRAAAPPAAPGAGG